MDDQMISEQIENALLKIVTHEANPDVIFIYIDTSVDEKMETIPFLNIFGNKVREQYNFDDALKMAVENEDMGFVADILEDIDSTDFEINLSAFYPDWPGQLESGDEKILTIINHVLAKHKEKFRHVKKMYFSYIDSLEFVKMID